MERVRDCEINRSIGTNDNSRGLQPTVSMAGWVCRVATFGRRLKRRYATALLSSTFRGLKPTAIVKRPDGTQRRKDGTWRHHDPAGPEWD